MRALLSAFDKRGLADFARGLVDLGWELIATGQTARLLAETHVPHRTVEDVTGQPEILGGRVKTLHPAIHAGILALRDNADHAAELQRHAIAYVDMVVANLYPFEATARMSTDTASTVEQIDIGGVALIRAAAKNFAHVAAVTDVEQYGPVLSELQSQGALSITTRRQLAARAFELTSRYDAHIAMYFRQEEQEAFPPTLVLALRKMRDLRYGENPHQQAAWYAQENWEKSTSDRANLSLAEQLRGKELSFTNLLDADAALSIVEEFHAPTAVLIKHTNPCGVASHPDLAQAFEHAYACDPVAAYGCVVAFNRPVDEDTARAMRHHFMEIILAPDYSDEAMQILQRKSKDLRILKLPIRHGVPSTFTGGVWIPSHELDVQRIHGGMLVQTPDVLRDDQLVFTPVTARHPTLEELSDLLFAWKAIRHVKSNSVVLAKDLRTVGIGAGQQSRVLAVEIAAKLAGERARDAVLATDGFFPFPDGIEAGARAGVTAIVHPGGGVREQDGIDVANAHGIAMVTTGGLRYFKH